METYKNLSGNSGVREYEIGNGYMVVGFKDGLFYKYTNARAGSNVVSEMMQLARQGRGLSTYISKNDPPYDLKW